MANEKQEIKKVVDILSHGESEGMYVVTAILEGGIEDTRAYPADSEEGKKFKAAAEKFVATHPKKGNHRMNLQFFGEYETRVKNAEKISKKKYTTGDVVLAGSLGVAATALTGLALFNAYTGKTNEETTVAPETTIETTVETPVEAEFDETKQTIKLTYDEATEVMTGFNNHINETLESNGFSRIDEKSEQALWILANNNNLQPETVQQFISEQRATADPRPMVENSFATWDAISENNTKYGLGRVENIIDISDYLVDEDARNLTHEGVKMLEELRALGYNDPSNTNLDKDKETAARIYDTIATYFMLDEYKGTGNVIGYHDEYESAGNVLVFDQAYANAIIGVLSEKRYITQQQSNAITGYHTDPSTGERKSNTAMLMVDEIMGEWRRTCVPEYTETYGGLTAEEVEYIRQQYAAQEAPTTEEKETTPTR